MKNAYAFGIGPVQRGGNGRNGDGTWPETDGQGCPVCGAIRGGGHGGGCPNGRTRFDEFGAVVGRKHPDDPVAAIERDLKDLRNP